LKDFAAGGAEQNRLAQCRHGLIKKQIGRLIAQLTEQIKQLICLNALLPQQLEHKGPRGPASIQQSLNK
jgi:hypothetical protein